MTRRSGEQATLQAERLVLLSELRVERMEILMLANNLNGVSTLISGWLEIEIRWLQRIQGFITAQNFYIARTGGGRISSEPAEIALWLDSFCIKNPLMHVFSGAVALVEAKGGPKAPFAWSR
jgi:hypothetical protein